MDIAIDTSAVLATLLDEPDRATILALTRGASLYAPASLHWEIGNALSAMLKRKRLTAEHAAKVVGLYQKISFSFVQVSLDKALIIANQHRIYAYDAYILACAQQRRIPLLSLDRGLVRIAKNMKLDVIDLEG